MGSPKTLPFIAAVMAFGLALTACSTSTSSQGSGDGAVGAGRTVRIKALDTLKFEPASVTATVGETVHFVVSNPGKTKHEFVLGDEATQVAHEEEMGTDASMEPGGMGSGMEHGGMVLAALELAAGETKETTITFDEAATILYGCHEPGHYKGGMVGTIAVSN